MRDKQLRKLLRKADNALTADTISVPDMSEKIKEIATAASATAAKQTTYPARQNVKKSSRVKAKLRVITGSPKKLVAASLAGVILISSLAGMFTWLFSGRLKFDFSRGIVASARAESAQYLPDVTKLTSSVQFKNNLEGMSFTHDNTHDTNTSSLAADSLNGAVAGNTDFTADDEGFPADSSTEVSASALNLDGFLQINGALAFIEKISTGLTTQVYDIYEIKAEIDFILKAAPIFDRWFRLPWMDQKHGYVANFPYNNWAYYLQSDADGSDITVTRVCSYYFGNFRYLENVWGSSHMVMLWQLMQTRFYYDGEGREVVECYVFTLLTDLKDRENGSWSGNDLFDKVNYTPVSVEYLKNVKDTSLTKYYIKFAESYNRDAYMVAGIDIRALNPYGSTFDFVQLNYFDENDITLLRLTGELPVPDIRNKPQATALSFYNKTGAKVMFYNSVHDYYDEENSTAWNDYPMPGGEQTAAKMDIVKLFSHKWPLITHEVEDYNCVGKKYGIVNYPGIASSGSVTRHSVYYCAGSENKHALLEQVYAAVNVLAASLGVTESLNSYSQIDVFLADIRRSAVENFDTAKWLNLGKQSVNSPVANDARGPFYGQQIPISNIATTGLTYPSDDNTFGVNCETDVLSKDIIDNPQQYAFKAAWVSNEGDYILIDSNLGRGFYHAGGDLYRFHLYAEVNPVDIEIEKSGIYTLIYVLTQIVDGNEVIIFDTQTHVNIFNYDVFLSLNSPQNHRLTCEARRLKLIVP